MKAHSLCAVFAFMAVAAFGQTAAEDCPMHKEHATAEKSPYVERSALPIKALSAGTIEAYRNGTGNGMASPAELNGYPGPRHILDLADDLNVTPEQRGAIKAIYDRMHGDAVRIGAKIIDLERKLDGGFARGTITKAELTTLTRDIAERQGRLRFVHLEAHLAAKKLLTSTQVEAYNRLRGYSD